jgi:hypothetical protein
MAVLVGWGQTEWGIGLKPGEQGRWQAELCIEQVGAEGEGINSIGTRPKGVASKHNSGMIARRYGYGSASGGRGLGIGEVAHGVHLVSGGVVCTHTKPDLTAQAWTVGNVLASLRGLRKRWQGVKPGCLDGSNRPHCCLLYYFKLQPQWCLAEVPMAESSGKPSKATASMTWPKLQPPPTRRYSVLGSRNPAAQSVVGKLYNFSNSTG